MKTFIRTFCKNDVEFIANNMREADKEELRAFGYKNHTKALEESVENSLRCLTCVYLDMPAFIFGIGKVEEKELINTPYEKTRVGIPWMLGTELMKNRAVQACLVRNSKYYVDEMGKGLSLMFNYVFEKNTLSQRWISWCGFTIAQEEALMVGKNKFYLFYKHVQKENKEWQ